ncbi:MAG: multicopper oxidase domain-containing protein [Undibacterium sp.]|nr:multicopper oxidase domain-containing protein [Opitutaceae bacterium]
MKLTSSLFSCSVFTRLFFALPFLTLFPAALPPPARAQLTAAAAEIRPTVTAAMGDVGGKLYGQTPDPTKTRRYYVAAESELWDFAPSGRDEICGGPLPPPVVAARKNGKLRYVHYTDATFTARVIAPPHLGILGPVLRGVVGEYLAVTFLNRTSQPLSMHPHGVKYDKDNEGAYYRPAPGLGAAVGPGATFTYVWQLDASSGPAPDEPSSKGWLYHSHVAGDAETNLGLIGAIIVTDPARARPDGTPRDIDREFATLFMIFDESGLDDAAIEAAEYANLPGAAPAPLTFSEMQQTLEQGARASINGRIFGNLPGLEMNEGERTRWYLFSLGSERDFHTAHWHGLRVLEEGRRRTDVVELLPATMKVADLVADNPGTWLFHCHVADHMREGMFTRLTVHARDTVGADRTPAHAFLGLPSAAQSVHLDRAELTADTFQLNGVATVYEGFAVFNQPIRVTLGEKSAVFRPDAHGLAETPEGTLVIENAGDTGVIRTGLLEFNLTLRGPAWRAALPPAGQPTTFTLDLGKARHVATPTFAPPAK